MNNLLSYCGLVDAKIRASDKDLPVHSKQNTGFYYKFDVGQIIIDNDYGDLSKFQGMSKISFLLNFFLFIILDLLY